MEETNRIIESAKVGFVCGTAIRIIPGMADAERLTLLEERYAHLQRHVAQQDKAMLGLGEELAKVRQELRVLRAQVTGGAPDSGEAADERPPHY